MIDFVENYSISDKRQIECESYIDLDSKYEVHSGMERRPINDIKFFLRTPTEITPNISIRKCYGDFQSSLQTNIRTDLSEMKKYFTSQGISTIGAEELLSESFNKWINEGKPKELSFTPIESIQIAKVLVTKDASLELLLMLAEDGPIPIETIYKAIPPKNETIKVLFDLWGFDLISLIGNRAKITSRGSELILKFRNNSQNR